jgi:nucleoid DNA-binding protein
MIQRKVGSPITTRMDASPHRPTAGMHPPHPRHARIPLVATGRAAAAPPPWSRRNTASASAFFPGQTRPATREKPHAGDFCGFFAPAYWRGVAHALHFAMPTGSARPKPPICLRNQDIMAKTAKKAAPKKAAKKVATKTAAKPAAPKPIKEALSKSALVAHIAEASGVVAKDVRAVMASLEHAVAGSVSKKGAGSFTLPGLLKITAVSVPAKPKRKGINPFTKEEQWFAAKPATTKLKVRPLKKLKDAAL